MRLVGSRRGAGLVDVMLTLFLLGVAGVIFAATFPTCFKATTQAQEYKLATAFAQKKMDQLRASNYASLNVSGLVRFPMIDPDSCDQPYSFTLLDGVGMALPSGTGELTITDGTDYANTKIATATVSWQAPDGTRKNVQMTTIIADKSARRVN